MKNLKYSIVSIFALCSVAYSGPVVKSLVDYDAQDMKKANSIIKTPAEQKKELLKKPQVAKEKKDVSNEPSSFAKENKLKKEINYDRYKKDFSFVKKKSVQSNGQIVQPVKTPLTKKSFKRNNFYLGLGLTALGIDSDNSATIFPSRESQDRQIGFTLKFGYNFFKYLFGELRGTYGIVNEADETKFKNIAFYLRPNYKLNSDLSIYGLVGYGSSNLQGEEVSGAGFSYGLGAKYNTFNNSGIYIDLVNYLSKSDSNSMWGLNIGVEAEF